MAIAFLVMGYRRVMSRVIEKHLGGDFYRDVAVKSNPDKQTDRQTR